MAKYQITAMLLSPCPEGYDEVSDPKAYADFQILETAYKYNDVDVMVLVLNRHRYSGGSVEEHNVDANIIVDECDGGFCLLERID